MHVFIRVRVLLRSRGSTADRLGNPRAGLQAPKFSRSSQKCNLVSPSDTPHGRSGRGRFCFLLSVVTHLELSNTSGTSMFLMRCPTPLSSALILCTIRTSTEGWQNRPTYCRSPTTTCPATRGCSQRYGGRRSYCLPTCVSRSCASRQGVPRTAAWEERRGQILLLPYAFA